MKLEKRIENIEKELAEIKKSLIEDIKWTRIGDLEWSSDLGEMNWHKAMAKAKDLGARVPTRIELIDLYDSHHEEMETLIEDSTSYNSWSATEGPGTNAWYVSLSSGYTYDYNKTFTNQLLVVREAR